MAPLSAADLDLLAEARHGVLATIAPDGRPRLVPFAFAVAPERDDGGAGLIMYSALDEKPKSVTDPRDLARVRDIAARPRVSLLVDRWSEDWSELAWLRLEGRATLIEPDNADAADAAEHALGVALLRAKYPQYGTQRLEQRPVLRIAIERARSWSAR